MSRGTAFKSKANGDKHMVTKEFRKRDGKKLYYNKDYDHLQTEPEQEQLMTIGGFPCLFPALVCKIDNDNEGGG